MNRITDFCLRCVVSLTAWMLLTAQMRTNKTPMGRDDILDAISSGKGEMDPQVYMYLGIGAGTLVILSLIIFFIRRRIKYKRYRQRVQKLRGTLKTNVKTKKKRKAPPK